MYRIQKKGFLLSERWIWILDLPPCTRLQQERLEAARVAEEMARKAAEEAVRQLEVEHSAKIVIETLPESNEQ